jgi:ferric-dicitrate binding protein FerR (iron transport regulator)
MRIPLYAHLAAKLLAHDVRSVVPPPSAADRAQATLAIERALAGRARARRRTGWLAGLAAAAAVAIVAGGAARWSAHHRQTLATAPAVQSQAAANGVQVVGYSIAGSASVVASGAAAPLDDQHPLATGSRVVTLAGSRALLAFATGTQVLVGETGDMTIAGEGTTQAVRLDHGSLELHVAKLAADQRFLVQTADAEIEVRGTAFRVFLVPPDPKCGAGTPTRVAVSEGTVVVRHEGQESRIEAGGRWPAGCQQAPTAARPTTPVAARSSPAPLPVSSLGEQNDLFGEAMAAKRRGDVGLAIDSFARFVAHYPTSPLAESAAVERMRLLRQTNADRAAVEARQYLARYPKGFACAEAEEIIAGSP